MLELFLDESSARRLHAKVERAEWFADIAVGRGDFVADRDLELVAPRRQSRWDVELDIKEVILPRRQAAVRPGRTAHQHLSFQTWIIDVADFQFAGEGRFPPLAHVAAGE